MKPRSHAQLKIDREQFKQFGTIPDYVERDFDKFCEGVKARKTKPLITRDLLANGECVCPTGSNKDLIPVPKVKILGACVYKRSPKGKGTPTNFVFLEADSGERRLVFWSDVFTSVPKKIRHNTFGERRHNKKKSPVVPWKGMDLEEVTTWIRERFGVASLVVTGKEKYRTQWKFAAIVEEDCVARLGDKEVFIKGSPEPIQIRSSGLVHAWNLKDEKQFSKCFNRTRGLTAGDVRAVLRQAEEVINRDLQIDYEHHSVKLHIHGHRRSPDHFKDFGLANIGNLKISFRLFVGQMEINRGTRSYMQFHDLVRQDSLWNKSGRMQVGLVKNAELTPPEGYALYFVRITRGSRRFLKLGITKHKNVKKRFAVDIRNGCGVDVLHVERFAVEVVKDRKEMEWKIEHPFRNSLSKFAWGKFPGVAHKDPEAGILEGYPLDTGNSELFEVYEETEQGIIDRITGALKQWKIIFG